MPTEPFCVSQVFVALKACDQRVNGLICQVSPKCLTVSRSCEPHQVMSEVLYQLPGFDCPNTHKGWVFSNKADQTLRVGGHPQFASVGVSHGRFFNQESVFSDLLLFS